VTIDDARIQKLRAEVLGQLDASRPAQESSGLEARVEALEGAVAALQRSGGIAPFASRPSPPVAASHPSLQVLGASGASGDRCVMEPDKPCVQSHACRTFGH
jgi:hypothetical protein